MHIYHVTSLENAQSILAEGFHDGEGTYMTAEVWRGVWADG